MHAKSFIAAAPNAELDSIVVICCPVGCRDTTELAASVAVPGDWPVYWCDKTAPILFWMASGWPPAALEARLPPVELRPGGKSRRYIVALVAWRGPPTHDQPLLAVPSSADFRVIRYCSGDYWNVTVETTPVSEKGRLPVAGSAADYCNAAPFSSIFGLWGDLSLELWPPDNDAVLVFKAQSFLWCKRQGYPIAPSLQCDWNLFQGLYDPVVRGEVRRSSRCARLRHEFDDLVQEAWESITRLLPKLVYDPAQGGPGGWLACLARRTVRRAARRMVFSWVWRSVPIEGREQSLVARDSPPDEQCSRQEESDRLWAALGRFVERTPGKNREVFLRRYMGHQSNKEVAVAMGMTPKAAQLCYDRTMREWRAVVGDLGDLGCGGKFTWPDGSPRPRKPR